MISVDNQVHVGSRIVFNSPGRIIDMKYHDDSNIYLLLQEEIVCLSPNDYKVSKVIKIAYFLEMHDRRMANRNSRFP
jgi:hypothetical protein